MSSPAPRASALLGLSGSAFGQAGGPWSVAAQEQGRPAQLRGLDLRRHLHAHRQAVRGRLGREGRFDHLLVQRPSDQARDHVRGRREDRRLAILALLLPQLRRARAWSSRSTTCRAPPTTSRTSRPSPSRWRRSTARPWACPTSPRCGCGTTTRDMLEKLKIDKPFATYEEFIEHCVKAKKDGVSRYPVLWVAGVGLEQLPGTWYQMTWNRGGTFFDKQGNHMLGRRLDRPRDAEMVGQHLREGPRHRRSRIAQGAVHHLGQGVRRRQEPLSRAQPPLWPQRRQRSGAVADRRQGQGPGLARRRQDHRRHPRLLPVDAPTATRNGHGSCCSISAARPRTATTRRPSASPRTRCWARATRR